MNIDKVRFRNEFVAPHLFQEVCSRQQFVAPLHHVFEQLKFARPQIDLAVTTLRCSIDEIELQRPHAQHRLIQQSWQPGERFSARYQFNYRERLF